MLRKGVDIGNQISQNTGVFVPVPIDNYIKIVCGIKEAARYSDDFYMVARTKEELHEVIRWLTGFDDAKLQALMDENATFESFFQQADLHPNAELIQGVICGYRIEEIEYPLTRQVRYLDKLVDELAKGRKMEKILREAKK